MMCQGECTACGANRKVNEDHGLCPECFGRRLAAVEDRNRYRYATNPYRYLMDEYDLTEAVREMEAYV